MEDRSLKRRDMRRIVPPTECREMATSAHAARTPAGLVSSAASSALRQSVRIQLVPSVTPPIIGLTRASIATSVSPTSCR
jgi:hypothetical protein